MILMLLPDSGFDPTEAAVPWWYLRQSGYSVVFATPAGEPSSADPRLLEGGFSLLSPLLGAKPEAVAMYREMVSDQAFNRPLAYDELVSATIEAVIIPGGHAAGVKSLLESQILQRLMVELFARTIPVGAICHGVVLLARSRSPQTGRSILYGRKTTALTKFMELSAWWITRLWLGDYYRTYATTVQDEVESSLACASDFLTGPILPKHDTPSSISQGFVVRDGNYLSARWPGDCNRFAHGFIQILKEQNHSANV